MNGMMGEAMSGMWIWTLAGVLLVVVLIVVIVKLMKK